MSRALLPSAGRKAGLGCAGFCPSLALVPVFLSRAGGPSPSPHSGALFMKSLCLLSDYVLRLEWT